jgi:lipid A 3-O-deacylase
MNLTRARLVLTFALLIMIAIFPMSAPAAEGVGSSSGPLITESGFITGIGTGNIHEGHYEPVLLIWHIGMDLKRYLPSLKEHKGTLTFYLEPQVNPVLNPETEIEFGVGAGFQYMYPVLDRLSPYVLISTGPHYISVKTNDQASGFAFANYFGAGLYLYLTKNAALNIGYRYRHVSNANTKKPNSGIDTHLGVIGFSLFF